MTQSGRTVIEEIKDRLDIVDVVSSRVELRRSGRYFKGLCPFHQEKTPSFFVFPDRQSYHCFGCGKSGDVISFQMETEGLAFREALEALAERAGVRLEAPKPRDPEEDTHEKRLLEINRLAARFFNHLLLSSEQAGHARDYLAGRGVERGAWETWLLGYAPRSWDSTMKFLERHGYSQQEIFEAGLVVEGKGGGYYDRFRGRVMFPIQDADGRYVAFGGRAIGDEQPKYMNSPDSPIFRKGELLYGLHLAADAVRREGQVVVVEGYVDAIAAHSHGFSNVVATLGTALTPTHVRMLSRLTRRVCLALDADTAGDAAAMRGWEVLRDAVQSRSVPIRTRGRVVASTRRADMEVRIASLPRGEDPDTLIRKSPERWRELIENARTVVDHFFDVVLAGTDLRSPEGRAQALAELAPVLADLGNPIERAHYESLLARAVGLDEHEVHAEVGRARRLRRSPNTSPAFASMPSVSQEELVLALVLRYPRLLEEIPEDFPDTIENAQNREILAVMARLGQEGLTAEQLSEAVEGALRQQVSRIVALADSQPELLSNEQPIELRRRLGIIRQRRLRELIHDHSILLKEAMDLGDSAGVRALLEAVPSLASEKREFDPPLSSYFKDSRER